MSRPGYFLVSIAGIFNVNKARDYIRTHKYQTWLLLDAANRVVLAYLAWRRRADSGEAVVKDTPAYRLGRSMDAKDSANVADPDRAAYKLAIDDDIKAEWMKTLAQGPLSAEGQAAIAGGGALDQKGKALPADEAIQRNADANAILKKVLMLLHSGLQLYDRNAGQHVASGQTSVVRALSHGGRVNIRIPALTGGDSAFALPDWLGITGQDNKPASSAVFERGFGTHHIAVGKNTAGPGTGKFREQGGSGAAVKSKLGSTKLYGVNLAVGGMGQKDFNGDVILPDGAHGHMFIGFRPPTADRDGALQIGIETTGPHAASTVGYAHTAKSTEATANPESSFGGLKADKVGAGHAITLKLTTAVKDKEAAEATSDEATNARFIDLARVNGGAWLTKLGTIEAYFAQLEQAQGAAAANQQLVGARRF